MKKQQIIINPHVPENLEHLVKEHFCVLDTVVKCEYQSEGWCPETCGMYQRAKQQVKYGGWRKG